MQLWIQNTEAKWCFSSQVMPNSILNQVNPLNEPVYTIEKSDPKAKEEGKELEDSIEPIENHLLGTKVFSCTYDGCDKVYKSNENLKLHINNIHLKIRPYSCRYCNLKFSHRNGKVYHERIIHEKKLPFKCDHCNKLFPTKSSKTSHFIYKHKHQHNKKT